MLYQVLIRRSTTDRWEPYSAPTKDPFAAMRLIQAAGQCFAEVTVMQADDAQTLARLLERLAAGEPIAQQSSPVPSLTSTPKISITEPARIPHAGDAHPWEHRLWEIECGPGGDHDIPYTFALPASYEVVTKWLRLLSLRWHEQQRTAVAEVAAPVVAPQPATKGDGAAA